MAYAVEANAILEIQRRQIISGQQCINVYHYGGGPAFMDGQKVIEEMLEDFDIIVSQPLMALQSEEIYGVYFTGQWVYPTRFVQVVRNPAVAQAAILTPAMTSGAAVVIRRRTDVASPSARGRVFIPGFPIADVTDSAMSNAWMIANAGDLAADMLEGVSSTTEPATLDPKIWSYADPLNAETVTSAIVDPVIRYQRRREVGRGI